MKPAALSNSSAQLLLVVLLGLASAGCAARRQNCVPTCLLRPDAIIDLNAAGDEARVPEHVLLNASLERLKPQDDTPVEQHANQHNVLALSGGGSYGAFTAGVLNGWSASGQRPQLSIVTGVSTGALISTFAFLGSEYDHVLRELYTNISARDIYHERPKVSLLWSDSAASSGPLQNTIRKQITPEILRAVAAAHAEGRRLYVGTTNLDTGRLVIWDMGAIASSGRGDATELYREIVLASASVPGFFPPVSIDVTINDHRYTELHVDGGTAAQVFFRASMLNLQAEDFANGRRPLAGSSIYIIVAGKAYADPQCVTPKLFDIAGNSLSALTYAQARNDLIRIYTLTLLTGLDYNVATIPQDLPISADSLKFEQASMRKLYSQGYQLAAANRVWAKVPPVVDASQQSIPRAGVQFFAPGGMIEH